MIHDTHSMPQNHSDQMQGRVDQANSSQTLEQNDHQPCLQNSLLNEIGDKLTQAFRQIFAKHPVITPPDALAPIVIKH